MDRGRLARNAPSLTLPASGGGQGGGGRDGRGPENAIKDNLKCEL